MNQLFLVDSSEISIGRAATSSIACIDLIEMSSVHLRIYKDGCRYMADMTGRNGGYVNGHFIRYKETVVLNFADEIELFDIRFLWLEKYIAVSTEKADALSAKVIVKLPEYQALNNTGVEVREKVMADEEFTYFRKAPRNYYRIRKETVELEAPPQRNVEESTSLLLTIGPAFTMALPMLLGFYVSRIAAKGSGSKAFMYTGVVTAMTSAIMGTIWAFSNIKNRQKQFVISEKRRQQAYTKYVSDSEQKIREIYNSNTSKLRLMYPSIDEYVSKGLNRHLLWNKSVSDDDFLGVRIGVGNVPNEIGINIPKDRFSLYDDELNDLPKRLKEKYSVLKDVPVTVDLLSNKCVGIVGAIGRELKDTFLTILISVCISVSPTDLKVDFLFDKNKISKDILLEMRFLPHLSETNQNYRVVFTDCYEKALGIYSKDEDIHSEKTCYIVVAEAFEVLPSECSLIIQKERHFNGFINISKDNSIRRNVYFDRVTEKDAFNIARLLQGVRIRQRETEFILPDKISFLELTGHDVTANDVIALWDKADVSSEINALIGIKNDSEKLILNFHEKGAGPHGLIAGMTGSGKSEILQTIILSLALNYSPEDVGFFLIDYKGGGMSKLFEKLPHILGSISNLSGNLVRRAMISVRSENERRQKKFNEEGVNNISEYQRLYKNGCIKDPMPHVFIIIDEFAELKREEPDFMKELISVARVGRSLGIHLILATQKPGGVVDDNILSNSKFRICLRLQDRTDSMEMLRKPDAANLTNPGRAYLQVGNDEIYLEFQGAYTMDKSPYRERKKEIEINELSGEILHSSKDIELADGSETQLERALKAIINAYNLSSHREIAKLWLSPLEQFIFYDKVKNKTDIFDISIGVYDDPLNQSQNQLIYNPIKYGNLVIIGDLQSGKSTLLSTIALSILDNISEQPVSMYFLDFSHGLLNVFRNSVLTGGYISEANEEDIEKLFILLKEIIDKRKELFRGGNYKQYLKRKDKALHGTPAVFVFIDGIGTFREKTKGAYDKDLDLLLKSGEPLGVYVFISAISISSSELPKRIFDNFKQCLALSLKDKYEYMEALSITASGLCVPDNASGRGLTKIGDRVVEFQAYLPKPSYDDFERTELMTEYIDSFNDQYSKNISKKELHTMVEKIPTIPKPLNYSTFIKEIQNRNLSKDESDNVQDQLIPVGFFIGSGKVYSIPVKDNLIVVISGRKKSGKTNLYNLIKTMIINRSTNCENYVNLDTRCGRDNYVNQNAEYDDDLEHIFLSNGMKIYVYDEKMPFEDLAEIKKAAGDDPYVIHLGGALDRQGFADFSNVPYSEQIRVLNPGTGTVRRTIGEGDYGNIVIPVLE